MKSQLQRIESLEQQLDAWKFRVEALEALVRELQQGKVHESNQEFYTVREIAEILALNEQIVRRHIRDGKIKATNVGKDDSKLTRWRISRAELERFKAGGTHDHQN